MPNEPDYSVVEKGLDFGIVGLGEFRVKTLNVSNPNPVRVPVSSITTNIEDISLKVESVWNSHGYRADTGMELNTQVLTIYTFDVKTIINGRFVIESGIRAIILLGPWS